MEWCWAQDHGNHELFGVSLLPQFPAPPGTTATDLMCCLALGTKGEVFLPGRGREAHQTGSGYRSLPLRQESLCTEDEKQDPFPSCHILQSAKATVAKEVLPLVQGTKVAKTRCRV